MLSLDKVLDFEDLDLIERVALKRLAEKSFLNFTRIFFELIQGDKLLVNWHHRWIAEEIDAMVRKGDLSNLAISIPPGGTKTELLSIHLPAYVNMLVQTGQINRFRNLNLSFSDSLVKRNSRRTRDIIASKEYQEFWGCSFGTNQAEEWQVINRSGKVVGETVSRSMGGQITGGRGGYYGPQYSGSITLDDPDKPEDMFSKTKREASHRKLTNTVRSRRGDKSKEHPTPFIIIQQRLHTEDTIGFCLAGKMGVKFKSISIPALVDDDYAATLPDHIREMMWKSVKDTDSVMLGGRRVWSYWPQMEHIEQLIDLAERDEYTFNSQYMQKPKEISGNLIDVDWFGRYESIPELEWAAIYVDTNSGKINDRNDYTVFSLCAKGIDGNLYILSVERGKWDPEELLTVAKDFWYSSVRKLSQKAVVRYKKVEDKQAGQGLITTLQRKNRDIIVDAVQRGTGQNKLIRYNNCQPQLKSGRVLIPATFDDNGHPIEYTTFDDGAEGFSTQWVMPFVSEAGLLTTGILMDQETGYDDQVDTILDAIDDMLISDLGNEIGVVRRRA